MLIKPNNPKCKIRFRGMLKRVVGLPVLMHYLQESLYFGKNQAKFNMRTP